MKELQKYGISLSGEQVDKLQKYARRVLQWNNYVNLTGAKDVKAFFTKHIEDCLSVIPFFSLKRNIIDVGSGCGLPGLILAISIPEAKIFAVEPLAKRHRFLNQVKIELEINNFVPINSRIQTFAFSDNSTKITEKPILVSRAFGKTKSFVDACKGFIDDGCEAYLMKSDLENGERQYLSQFDQFVIHNLENSSFEKRLLVSFKSKLNS